MSRYGDVPDRIISDLQDEVSRLKSEHAAQRTLRRQDEVHHLGTIEKVREIHAPIDAAMYSGQQSRVVKVCTGCGTDDGNWTRWPCPTVRAIDSARSDTEETP